VTGPEGRDAPEELGRPSKFWAALGAQHQRDLTAHGFADLKRRQALRYFTWSWHLRSIGGSEQMRHLLRRTPPTAWLRSALLPFAVRGKTWAPLAWSVPDRWLYSAAIRLLWEYALEHGEQDVLGLPEPLVGNPLPVRHRGRLISQDLANSALEAGAVKRVLDGTVPCSILEVGAGYGRTAYALMSIYPAATYTIVDIEPALGISRWYLSQLFAPDRLRFLTPDQVDELETGSVDLALSISSLQEMTPSQVAGYLGLIDRVAAGGRVYLKQWAEWRNPDDGVTMRFAEFPIPERWTRTVHEAAPVQDRFIQAGWRVPAPVAVGRDSAADGGVRSIRRS
jgi:putative sugar O-methyltransferase